MPCPRQRPARWVTRGFIKNFFSNNVSYWQACDLTYKSLLALKAHWKLKHLDSLGRFPVNNKKDKLRDQRLKTKKKQIFVFVIFFKPSAS